MRIIPQKKKILPLKIVGSNIFGRYAKISIEETFNMIISDNFLVPYAGYEKTKEIQSSGEGRGILLSTALNKLVIVINNNIYFVTKNENVELRANIDTYTGDVYIAENNNGQIAICDLKDIYVIDYKNNIFGKAVIDFVPNYISFQNGYFIATNSGKAEWRLSALNDGFSWPADAPHVGEFESNKADLPRAAIPLPGKENQLLVMGSNVTQLWTDVGYRTFPYQKTTAFNIDYGCVNQSTIAISDNFVIWVGINEKSGPAIIYTNGGEVKQVSNDGINFKLANLTAIDKCYGFLFKQDGHLIYQITFYQDNITYIYDFNTKSFFTLTDTTDNHHIAKRIAYFNNKYYFISFTDGSLYQMSSDFATYDGRVIPRWRICPAIRFDNSSDFIVDRLCFTVEQGMADELRFIDVSFSIDGGNVFSNTVRRQLNALGKRKNKLEFWNLGRANDFIPKFRFWGKDRFVVGNGEIEVHT